MSEGNGDRVVRSSENRVYVRGDLEGVITPQAVTDEVRQSWLRQREAILKIPSQELGLNMDRVHRYCQRIGISGKPIRILRPEDYAQAREIGRKSSKDYEDNFGIYLDEQDVILVNRDPNIEADNDPEFLESIIIHEAAHSANGNSTSRVDVSVMRTRRFRRPEIGKATSIRRSGFIVRSQDGTLRGKFLEEAYAELERGLYVTSELKKETGFTDGVEPGILNLLDKYTFVNRKEPSVSPGALPAIILNLLIEHDPELLTVLRGSRHSLDGLRESARRIDHNSPGLYRRLRDLDISSPDDRTRQLSEMIDEVIKLKKGTP